MTEPVAVCTHMLPNIRGSYVVNYQLSKKEIKALEAKGATPFWSNMLNHHSHK